MYLCTKTSSMKNSVLLSDTSNEDKSFYNFKSFIANNIKRQNLHLTFRITALLLSFFFIQGYFSQISGQTTSVPFTTTGNNTWYCPAGVTSITVECWGGGGAGGGATGNPAAGGGGAGGAYTRATIDVTPGTTYNLSVGAGGTGNTTTTGPSGGSSWFNTSTALLAVGGTGGARATSNNQTAAGAISPTTGNLGGAPNYYGGNGGTGGASGASGGGGGGSAGTASNGNPASGVTGGSAVTGGGAGVNGSTTSGDGADNTNLGGGGAGGRAGNFTDRSGGNGGNGKVIISYPTPGTYISLFTGMSIGSATWCTGETRTITVTVKNNGTAAWVDIPRQDINVGVKWDADPDYLVRTDVAGLAPGATGTYNLTVTAPATTGTNHLTFDIVYEAVSWFAGNGGGVGPGNVVSASSALTIISAVPSQPGVITGSTAPCFGSSQTYFVTNVAGVTYNWAFPAGWAQTAGGTSNSVTVTVGSGSGNITVTPSNVCGNGTVRTLGVNPTVPVAPTVPAANICTGNTATLTASGAVSGDKYKWYDAASGGTLLKISTNNTDNTYTTATLTGTTNYWVSILKAAGCESARTMVTVTVSNPVSSVNSQTNVSCFGGNDGSITIHASGGIIPYGYSVDNGLSYIISATDPYTYGGLNATTNYKIRVKDSIGCESFQILP